MTMRKSELNSVLFSGRHPVCWECDDGKVVSGNTHLRQEIASGAGRRRCDQRGAQGALEIMALFCLLN